MKLIDAKWNNAQKKIEYTYLADAESDVKAPAEDCAIGSQILVIDTGAAFVKNTAGKWQKLGTKEVLA